MCLWVFFLAVLSISISVICFWLPVRGFIFTPLGYFYLFACDCCVCVCNWHDCCVNCRYIYRVADGRLMEMDLGEIKCLLRIRKEKWWAKTLKCLLLWQTLDIDDILTFTDWILQMGDLKAESRKVWDENCFFQWKWIENDEFQEVFKLISMFLCFSKWRLFFINFNKNSLFKANTLNNRLYSPTDQSPSNK